MYHANTLWLNTTKSLNSNAMHTQFCQKSFRCISSSFFWILKFACDCREIVFGLRFQVKLMFFELIWITVPNYPRSNSKRPVMYRFSSIQSPVYCKQFKFPQSMRVKNQKRGYTHTNVSYADASDTDTYICIAGTSWAGYYTKLYGNSIWSHGKL